MKVRQCSVSLFPRGVSPRCILLWRPFVNARQCRHYIRQSRRVRKLASNEKERLAKREQLRSSLLRQYEEESKPMLVRNAVRFEQSSLDEYYKERSPDQHQEPRQELRQSRDDDINCGIFWDIENVRQEYMPPTYISNSQF